MGEAPARRAHADARLNRNIGSIPADMHLIKSALLREYLVIRPHSSEATNASVWRSLGSLMAKAFRIPDEFVEEPLRGRVDPRLARIALGVERLPNLRERQ
jgi:hypothetical protein